MSRCPVGSVDTDVTVPWKLVSPDDDEEDVVAEGAAPAPGTIPAASAAAAAMGTSIEVLRILVMGRWCPSSGPERTGT
jgi:hypothetical protein